MIVNKVFESEKELNTFVLENGYKVISIESIKKEKYTGLMTMNDEFSYMADYFQLWYDDSKQTENIKEKNSSEDNKTKQSVNDKYSTDKKKCPFCKNDYDSLIHNYH